MEFTLTITIKTSANSIYKAWLSSEEHSMMTGGEAEITDSIGDEFTAWDGYIEGKNIELEDGQRILQSWRTSQFEENEEDSLLEITLHENNGETELILTHSNVPESGEHYINGWDQSYFQPMKEYFENFKN